MTHAVRKAAARHSRGQAAVEFMLALMTVGATLFVPWQGGESLAQILLQAISGFLEATISSLSLV